MQEIFSKMITYRTKNAVFAENLIHFLRSGKP